MLTGVEGFGFDKEILTAQLAAPAGSGSRPRGQGAVIYFPGDIGAISRRSYMADLSALELEVAHVIVDALNLEDVRAENIGPEEPLFRDGLGLDSIDALEIALAISMKYGFQIRSDDNDDSRIFASLRSLSHHVEENRIK